MSGASPIRRATSLPQYSAISKTVHPDDEMFWTAKKSLPKVGEAANYYFYGGGFVANNLASWLRDNSVEPIRSSILDFGCGYGRVTRHLVHMFKSVTVMDIDPKMLEFAKSEFSLDGCLSAPSLEAARWPDRAFDVVFSFSVFTHLHPSIWAAWFERLLQCVEVGGHMVITTRGAEFHKARGGKIEGDVNYEEKNENPNRLDLKVYGQTTVTPAFISRQIAPVASKVEHVATIAGGGFDLYQDANIFRRVA